MKKKILAYILFLLCCFLCISCKGKSTDTDDEKVTKEPPMEKVTEIQSEEGWISFSEIEQGLNFKATSETVTFQFEDRKEFDNSLKLEFALSDASYEMDTIVLAIEDGKDSYSFENLKKGQDYYLEVYPTKTAASDQEMEAIQEKNGKCRLKLMQ